MNAHGCVRTLVTLTTMLVAARSTACPFCNAVTPTFAERRESAAALAFAEAVERSDESWRFQIHRVHEGEKQLAPGETVDVNTDAELQAGDLALLLADADDEGAARDAWRWSVTRVDPASYLYFSKSPGMRVPAAERLRYFLPHLDDENQDVSADAFAELGRAPLEAVEAVADGEIIPQLREWIRDDALPNERRGGYGLMLGLVKDPTERATNANALREVIDREREDFRAGFDGVLAGYLLLEPVEALQLIDERYLAQPEARPGDTRHALAALRFCVEYDRGPERSELLKVVRHALDRPAFAADVVKDLARWKDWAPLDAIAALYATPGDQDPLLRRAVVGYLKACPLPEAEAHLSQLRTADPDGIQAIERRLALPIDR